MPIHAQNIRNLRTVYRTSASKINYFCGKLLHNVQWLKILGKLKEFNAWLYIRTIDHRLIIRGELRSGANRWRRVSLGFSLVEVLKKWTERNPVSLGEKRKANGFKSQRVKIWIDMPSKGIKIRATARAETEKSEKVYVYRDGKITDRSRDTFLINLFQA